MMPHPSFVHLPQIPCLSLIEYFSTENGLLANITISVCKKKFWWWYIYNDYICNLLYIYYFPIVSWLFMYLHCTPVNPEYSHAPVPLTKEAFLWQHTAHQFYQKSSQEHHLSSLAASKANTLWMCICCVPVCRKSCRSQAIMGLLLHCDKPISWFYGSQVTHHLRIQAP